MTSGAFTPVIVSGRLVFNLRQYYGGTIKVVTDWYNPKTNDWDIDFVEGTSPLIDPAKWKLLYNEFRLNYLGVNIWPAGVQILSRYTLRITWPAVRTVGGISGNDYDKNYLPSAGGGMAYAPYTAKVPGVDNISGSATVLYTGTQHQAGAELEVTIWLSDGTVIAHSKRKYFPENPFVVGGAIKCPFIPSGWYDGYCTVRDADTMDVVVQAFIPNAIQVVAAAPL